MIGRTVFCSGTDVEEQYMLPPTFFVGDSSERMSWAVSRGSPASKDVVAHDIGYIAISAPMPKTCLSCSY